MFLCLAQTSLVCASLRLQMSPLTDACISRQLHRQPEQLLLHQRQRPALLQESQEPVSLSRLITLWTHMLKAFVLFCWTSQGPRDRQRGWKNKQCHYILFALLQSSSRGVLNVFIDICPSLPGGDVLSTSCCVNGSVPGCAALCICVSFYLLI